MPGRLLHPRLLAFVPDLPRLRFQAVHSRDVGDAYRRAIVGDARGAFNVAAEPVLDSQELARLLQARTVRVPERLARAATDLTWRLHLQPTPPGWVDLALKVPLLDVSRAQDELAGTRIARPGRHCSSCSPACAREPERRRHRSTRTRAGRRGRASSRAESEAAIDEPRESGQATFRASISRLTASCSSALASICRTRSRVRPSSRPIASSEAGSRSPFRP